MDDTPSSGLLDDGSSSPAQPTGPVSVQQVSSLADLAARNIAPPRDGYADDSTAIVLGVRIAVEDVARFETASPLQLRPIGSADFDLSILNDSASIVVEVDGKSYTLRTSRFSGATYESVSGLEEAYLTRLHTANRNLEYVLYEFREIVASIDPDLGVDVFTEVDASIGLYTIGYETDPTIVNSLTSSAVYTGEAALLISGLGAVGYLEGETSLSVDLEDSSIAGSALLRSVANTVETDGFSVLATDVELALDGSIGSEGQISGTFEFLQPVTLLQLERDRTALVTDLSGTLTGGFYGPVADGLGGQMIATGQSDDGSENINVLGSFATSR